eukprot:TRINITY_DN40577_c0_g1_i1.p1 TRINITY_DN40577_c0_g1~~TRINITY_DN40577_c0_g1_i1.p1  ORF type:complete len:559 (-),score=71.07 TRINITY_DN40577_c0_g1_i1:31-1707(-)
MDVTFVRYGSSFRSGALACHNVSSHPGLGASTRFTGRPPMHLRVVALATFAFAVRHRSWSDSRRRVLSSCSSCRGSCSISNIRMRSVGFSKVWHTSRAQLLGTAVEVRPPVQLAALSEPEDRPQVVRDDGGELLVAWKPAKMSMKRPRGGGHSEMEAWAVTMPGLVASAAPNLGRAVGGLVFLGRNHETVKAAAASMSSDRSSADVIVIAILQGEPTQAELANVLANARGSLLEVRVLEASEGLRLGRLSVVRARLRPGNGCSGEKILRKHFASIQHRIIGNGEDCARAAGVRRTYLAVVGLRLGSFAIEVPAPPSFARLLQADALSLSKRGVQSGWTGRTEHCSGEVQFDGLSLKVPSGVFVPRRSALHVVEAAAALPVPAAPLQLLDCGTGSGCILLALLRRHPGAHGLGIDVDPAAVAAAAANAAAGGLADRCDVKLQTFGDLGDLPRQGIGPFHVVVSNPPYLPERLMRHVGFARELRSQSSSAFVAGEDGRRAYQELALSLAETGVLYPGAWIVVGCQPGKAAFAAGHFATMACYKVHALKEQCAVLIFRPAS